jgi:hypothetical protein
MIFRRRIPLPLGAFGMEAVEHQAEALGLGPDRFVARAAIYHLRSRREGRPQLFLDGPPAETTRVLTVQLEPASWAALEAEASGTGITVPQLLARASLALAADLDSGRVASLLGADAGAVRAA